MISTSSRPAMGADIPPMSSTVASGRSTRNSCRYSPCTFAISGEGGMIFTAPCLALGIFFLFKLEAHGIHAVSSSSVRGSILKHMPEMRSAFRADYLCAPHAVTPVFSIFHSAGNRIGEARPSGTGIELHVRRKKRRAADNARIHAGLFVIHELTRERRFRPLFLRHAILLGREFLLYFFFVHFCIQSVNSRCISSKCCGSVNVCGAPLMICNSLGPGNASKRILWCSGGVPSSSSPTMRSTGIVSFFASGMRSYFRRSSMCDHGSLLMRPGTVALSYSLQPVLFHSSILAECFSDTVVSAPDTTVETGARPATFSGWRSA